jgi:hypothetical protein
LTKKLAVSHRGAEAAEPEEKGKGWVLSGPNPFFFIRPLRALCSL